MIDVSLADVLDRSFPDCGVVLRATPSARAWPAPRDDNHLRPFCPGEHAAASVHVHAQVQPHNAADKYAQCVQDLQGWAVWRPNLLELVKST
eukprot:CAMPEP_0194548360 /NCGR_PEP_ID=MMETSP0253-20130528/93518_1 /TAXON_ID=2966 /ORGANISM="Noctiluca scintillans" /LENGTH=91 /DNA_ID=CAMNT_0039395661 /DNA_START=17 /DNA_END=288 /DNA_ORIENTATION=-